MALNKRKVLDAARKFAQKGAKQKALKEYNKLIQADPRDAKLQLEVGEAYRRWGQIEEAIAQYTKVSNQYKQDGFDARAVAVLKQILKLDTKRYTAYVSLAELYQRMGLDSEALGALQTAADGYYRDGNRREALELLRKSASLDPSNTTSRLTVANLLTQEGLDDEAVGEYEEVAAELARQGAQEQVTVVHERILELKPDRVDILSALAQGLIDLGMPERAEPFAARAVEHASEPAHLELLCSVYKGLGNETRLAEVTRELAGQYRDRGEEDKAREVMQRLPADSVYETSGLGSDRSELDEDGLLGDDELLEDDDFLATSDADLGGPEPELGTPQDDLSADPRSAPVEVELTEPEAEAGGETHDDPLPEGDPDQLLAEASVYLRYGKRDQAIGSLKAVLVQEPDHRGALEKLGEAYAENDQDPEAIDCWRRAAVLAREDEDGSTYDLLRDRISELDPAAAADLGPMPSGDDEPVRETPASADAEETDPGLDESEADELLGEEDHSFELDFDESESAEVSSSGSAEADDQIEVDESDLSFDLEVDLGDGDADDAAAGVGVSADANASDTDFEIDIDTDDSSSEDDVEPSTSVSHLDDADMGIELQIDDEEAGAPTAGRGAAEPGQVDASADTDFDLDVETSEFELDEHDAQQPLPSPADASAASDSGGLSDSIQTPAKIQEEMEEAEFYVQQGLVDEAEAIYQRILSVAPNHPSALLRLGELAAERGEDPDPTGHSDPAANEASLEIGVDSSVADEGDLEIEIDDDSPDVEIAFDEEEDAPPLASDESENLADLMAAAVASVDAAETNADEEEDTEREVSPEAAVDGPLGNMVGEDSTQVETLGAPSLAEPDAAFAPEPVQAEPAAHRALAAEDTMPFTDMAAEDDEATAPGHAAGAASQEQPVAERPAGDENFDLAEALADVFEDSDEQADSLSGLGQSTAEQGFESIFADFKKGVSATLEEGDFDTRYDLGIAYREMGLYDDAISEFTVCLDSPVRRFEALYMMGVCALDVGRPPDAISHLEQALATPALPDDRQAGIYFDLGRAYLMAGDGERARSALESVRRLDPELPGVDEQLAAIDATSSGSLPSLALDDDESGYESFADLMDGDDAGEASGEALESFDDVITDPEVVDAELEVTEVDLDSEDVPEAGAEPAKKSRRKKKISFV